MKKDMFFKTCLITLLGIAGTVFMLLMNCLTNGRIVKMIRSVNNLTEIALITGSFSFAVLAFLAIVAVFVLDKREHPFVREYLTNQRGNFFTVYFTTMLSSTATFAMSVVLAMTKSNTIAVVLLGNALSNALQLSAVSTMFFNLMRKSRS